MVETLSRVILYLCYSKQFLKFLNFNICGDIMSIFKKLKIT